MFSKILIPVDDSRCSAQAGRVGLEFARQIGAVVLVIHVLNNAPGFMGLEPSPAATERYLKTVLNPWRKLGRQMGLNLQTEYLSGDDVVEGIVFAAKRDGCDLIVMGTHGRKGLSRVLLGSIAEEVSRLAPVPVMLGREGIVISGLRSQQTKNVYQIAG